MVSVNTRNVNALSSLGVNPTVTTTRRNIPALSSLGVNPTVSTTKSSKAPITQPKDGGGGGGVPNIGPEPVPVPQIRGPQIGDWRDAAYNSQIASIERALRDFETGATTRGERYGQDFMTGLGRLGYRPAEGFVAMPNILEALNQPQAMARMAGADGAEPETPAVAVPPVSGGFDIEGQFDPFSAAARGTRGLRDEFAGRGTLRSSDFARTFGEFQNRLNQQLQAMEQGRTRFGEDLATEVAQQRTLAEERRQATQRDAQQRAIMAALAESGF